MAPLLPGRLLIFFSVAAAIFLFCPLRSAAISIHDLLKSQGLPAGLFPKEVKNYTLSEDGVLEVFLDGPCLTKFDTMAFYESVVRANLSHGGLSGVQGFSQEELFVWLPVKGVIVDDPASGLIFIDIGLAHKQLSLSLFEDPPDCKNDGVLEEAGEEEERFEDA
ncbi:PREDICTED: uncharacterized protein LOC109178210 isoform X2 [Ipomoea nil]|uniref:uncharacterized protein LOC109178210 isoform X2 n=1 Tax=Ipomoea nil TaxID=35883 RepID=UPI000900F9E8|nr:PREDICTED: uncharacterized protein LOC109178210 isoform X2 [Ipomoea nil]